MPISKAQFEEMEDDGGELIGGTNATEILNFLRANPDRAFTLSEIADETDIKIDSVGPTLIRLYNQGRVDYRGKYWRVSDHEQGINAATNHAAAALSYREVDEGIPRMEEWQEHAVDPRDHRDE